MRRMVKGSVALVLGVCVGMVVLGSGRAALAQESTTTTLPLHPISVTPDVVSVPKQKVTVLSEGFPDQQGCRFGNLFALAPGQTVATTGVKRLLQDHNFDPPVTVEVDRWADGTYFTEGTFDLVLTCRDDSGAQTGTYRTGATLTVLASGVPPPDPVVTTLSTTTTLGPTTTTASTKGTVEPSTGRAGETTVTIRGNGFKPKAKLEIALDTTPKTVLGTTEARDNGEYAATILIPATAPAGQHKLLVTGPGPDDVTRSTSADLLVLAATRTGTGTGTGSRTAAATGSGGTTATGSLPATGPTERTPYLVVAGLTAMTLGAFLVGMSHPAVPSGGRHRRRRLHRR